MEHSYQQEIWRQFGASIDMLGNAIKRCPTEYWDTKTRFWYNAYHSIFWLDYYLSLKPEKFNPPSPFTLSEFESATMPDRTYSQKELLSYLKYCRDKSKNLLEGMSEEVLWMRWINKSKNYSVFEVLLYNMRHVQHHAAQLNLLLRQAIDDAPKWVSIVEDENDI